MTTGEALNNFLTNNPKTVMILINALIASLLILCKHYFDNYTNKKEIMYSSKVYLISFSKILVNAILNDKKELAKDHYIILLNSSSVFKDNKQIYDKFIELQKYYIALQVESFNESLTKERCINKIEIIEQELESM